jgi:hypothetical protein
MKLASFAAGNISMKLVVPVSGCFEESSKHSEQQMELCPFAPL